MKKKFTPDDLECFLNNNYMINKFLTDDDIGTLFKEWELNNGVNYNDFLWLLLNKSMMVNAEKMANGNNPNFYNNKEQIYYNMAHFRRNEGGTKESINKLIRLAFESSVEGAKSHIESSVEYEINVIANIKGKCEYARSEYLKKYEVNEFLDKCFIATDKCTNENGCSCSVGHTVKRDSNGRNIRLTEEKEINIQSNIEPKGCSILLLSLLIIYLIITI